MRAAEVAPILRPRTRHHPVEYPNPKHLHPALRQVEQLGIERDEIMFWTTTKRPHQAANPGPQNMSKCAIHSAKRVATPAIPSWMATAKICWCGFVEMTEEAPPCEVSLHHPSAIAGTAKLSEQEQDREPLVECSPPAEAFDDQDVRPSHADTAQEPERHGSATGAPPANVTSSRRTAATSSVGRRARATGPRRCRSRTSTIAARGRASQREARGFRR